MFLDVLSFSSIDLDLGALVSLSRARLLNKEYIDDVNFNFQINFFLPEHELVKINDEGFNQIFINGSGDCNVY